jgi:DNA helicase-2/ATP-dependent DNA helicase PcrA
MAISLRAAQDLNPDWRVSEFVAELQAISENERRFIGIEDIAIGYEPRPGVITVSTMHAAKGLEWDRVYLLGVNNYSFPSAEPGDMFISEKWFVRDHLNLEAETLAQVDALRDNSPYHEGFATGQARLDYASERLRLLYVGITRARRELVILWNTGRYSYRGGTMVCQPALPLTALFEYLGGTRIMKRPN